MRLVALLASVLLASIVPHDRARAQTAEWSPARAGTRFYVSGLPGTDFFDVTVAADDYVQTMTQAGPSTSCMWPLIVAFNVPIGDEAKLKPKLWPLKVGNEVEYNGSWESRVVVRSTETIQLRLGSVDTYVVDIWRRTYDQTGAKVEYVLTYWYAPQYGFVVKFEFEPKAGFPPRLPTWVVTQVVPPSDAAAAALSNRKVPKPFCATGFIRP